MRLLDVVPEKIHCTISLDTDELHLLKKSLDMCVLEYDGTDPEDVKIENFFLNDFSKLILEIHKNLLEEE